MHGSSFGGIFCVVFVVYFVFMYFDGVKFPPRSKLKNPTGVSASPEKSAASTRAAGDGQSLRRCIVVWSTSLFCCFHYHTLTTHTHNDACAEPNFKTPTEINTNVELVDRRDLGGTTCAMLLVQWRFLHVSMFFYVICMLNVVKRVVVKRISCRKPH